MTTAPSTASTPYFTTDTQNLMERLKSMVLENWQRNAEPLLLSNVAPMLASIDPSYKAILDGKRLKQFVTENAIKENGYQVVTHPTQKAKIGLIPFDESFEYETDTTGENGRPSLAIDTHHSIGNTKTSKHSEGLALIKALGKLSENDLEKINIPISVLVKLFQ